MTTAREFILTERDEALLPSAEDIQFFAEHGWYLSKKLFTDDEVDELAAAADRYYAGERDRRLPAKPPRLAYWEPAHGPVKRENDYVHYENDALARLVHTPLIGAVAARLARSEEIRVFQTTLILKPPAAEEPTNLVPWHSDRHYWASASSDQMLTAFIPFHDCGEEMGTITMVDRSHLWPQTGADQTTAKKLAEHDSAHWEAMLADHAAQNDTEVRKIPMIIPKGHVSFHHSRIYHGSGVNRSSQPRRVVTLHMQDAATTYREFQLPNGRLASHNHDWLVRRTPDGRPDYADPDFCPTLWRTEEQERCQTSMPLTEGSSQVRHGFGSGRTARIHRSTATPGG